jgi:hypothetical protein
MCGGKETTMPCVYLFFGVIEPHGLGVIQALETIFVPFTLPRQATVPKYISDNGEQHGT